MHSFKWPQNFFECLLTRFERPARMPHAFHFRGKTVIYATIAPLLPPTLPRLRGSPEMQNIHNIKIKCEHSYTEINR